MPSKKKKWSQGYDKRNRDNGASKQTEEQSEQNQDAKENPTQGACGSPVDEKQQDDSHRREDKRGRVGRRGGGKKSRPQGKRENSPASGQQQERIPNSLSAGRQQGGDGASTADNKPDKKQCKDGHFNERHKQGNRGSRRGQSLDDAKEQATQSKCRGKPPDSVKKDQQRPGLINRKPDLSTQQNARPHGRGMFFVKNASFDPKTLKEKDSREVAHALNEGLPRLTFYLRSQQEQHISEEFIYDLTCTLAKACEAPSGENTNNILAAIKGSVFLNSKIPTLLDRVKSSTAMNEISLQRLISCLLIIFMKYLKHLPSSYADLPYTSLKVVVAQSSIHEKEELLTKLDEFKQARDDIIRRERERQRVGKRYVNKAGEKPPNDFREIPICPTSKEIMNQDLPFLRKNLSKGKYDNVEHYLDVQFRLLREDFLQPLREGIQETVQNVPRQHRKQVMMKIFRRARIVDKKFTWSGIIHKVQINVSGLDTRRWPQSKRLLYGSFLCLSNDNFQSMYFATVANRHPEELREGRIDIRFIEEQDVLGIESLNYVYQMVESPAYFEAYRHVLRGLKELDETTMPFKKYLVECRTDVDPPEYLRQDEAEQPVCYDLSKALDVPDKVTAKAVPVLTPEAWPSVTTLRLNSSQLEALRTALTTEFCVIQGPPGTGKTYVGAKIVRCLLENRSTWDPQCISPMLMVCYTNHALDQFLEKVLEFLLEKEVIRVGGRSKSLILEECNLKRFTDKYRLNDKRREVRLKMGQNKTNRKGWMENLTKANESLLELNDLEDVLCPEHVDQLYNAIFPSNVEDTCRTPSNTFKLWLCDNKLLRSCNQSTTKETDDNGKINPEGSPCKDTGADDLFYDPSLFTAPQDAEGNNTFKPQACATRHSSENQSNATGKSPSAGKEHLEMAGLMNDGCASARNSCGENVEETIVVEKEADLIQDTRWLEGEEDLVHEIPEENNDLVGQEQDHTETGEDDGEWIEVKYRKRGSRFVWLHTETESSKGKCKGVSVPDTETEDEMAAATSPRKKKNKNKNREKPNNGKINISGDISCLEEKLKKEKMMSIEEALAVDNIWGLSQSERLRMYLFWIESYRERHRVEIQRNEQEYEQLCEELEEVQFEEEEQVMRRATVVGMTTSGAARYHSVLRRIAPKIVVIEEAAEVMESHIITSLSQNTKHTILIGDHKQLRPKATVYELAQTYNLEVSLFERMVMNNVDCKQLSTQHRMRPEIAALTKRIYDHEIIDHESVFHFQDVSGICRNLFFIDHCHDEFLEPGLQSYSNPHEASFLVALCNYLLLQGYNRSQITILTMYTGQLLRLQEGMPRRRFGGVRVCAVDNFQGEENDIILLSLVRSNSNGHIGFLNESNRICVALSRARKGLYCIGNFGLLKGKCKLWKEICHDLEVKEAIGNSLQLVCKRHNKVTSVQNARDFNELGGCNMPCGDRLDCGHACAIPCHTTSHSPNCNKRCFSKCSNEHQCQSRCHYPRKCPPCRHEMIKTVPTCSHEQNVPCSVDPAEFICRAKCEKVLPCGHRCANGCGQSCTKQCQVSCIKTLPCRHEKSLPCFQNPSDFTQCKSNCTKILECGHPCSKKCKQTCQCNTEIEVQLPCKHTTRILCHKKNEQIRCMEKCERVLDCGHDCPGICHEDCGLKRCKNLVLKDLPCGHQQMAPCFQDRKTAFCFAPCSRTLDCGHKCSSVCGRPCHDVRCEELCKTKCERGHPCANRCHFGSPCKNCMVVVPMTIPTCGHSIQMSCYIDPSSVKCQERCKRIRVCGHPCKEICYTNCETQPCKEPVPRRLPCSHVVNLACHKNPAKFVCRNIVEVQLSCGHKTSLECHVEKAGLDRVFCRESMEKKLPCNHKKTLPCFKNPEDCICREKVDVELPCGHTKSFRCFNVTAGMSNVFCTVKVTRRLACNHEVTIACHIEPQGYSCQEEVEITLRCGHKKITACSNMKNELQGGMCDTMVTRKLHCGHEKKMKCSSKPEEVLCDTPCERFLSCYHRCSRKCGEDCNSFKCAVKVQKDLSCGYHSVTCLCSEDVSELICLNPCERALTCGHQCPGKCYEECSQFQCKRTVMKNLGCEGNHSLKMHCKDEPSSIICEAECTRKLQCGHPCPGKCSQPCEMFKCTRRVEHTYRCGHMDQIKCYQRKTATCKAPCTRREKCKHLCKGLCGEPCSKYPCKVTVTRTLACGHKINMRCSDSADDVQCFRPCGKKLPCGHQCSGTCNECRQSGSHEICQQPCGRRLVCSHRCQAKCSEPCLPCNKKCARRCPHTKCTKSCSQDCGPCKQPCRWSCPHYQCNNLCGEECDRPRCDAPCPKRLKCRHPCIGLCGENCPTMCAICHAKRSSSMLGKITEGTRYLQLFDCGHIVKVEEMDAWMMRDFGNDVQLICCPKCSAAITFSYRYGNIIKETLKNVKHVTAQVHKLSQEARNFSSGLVDTLSHFRHNLNKMSFPRNVSLIFTLKNHLLIMDEVKKAQSCLPNVEKHQARSKELLAIKQHLEKITDYLEKPQLDLATLNQVHEHTRKFFYFASILEAQSVAIKWHRSFTSTGNSRLKAAQEKFNLFVQGNDAVEMDWLERITALLRREVGLATLPPEKPKVFENFPGFNKGVWKLCEHRLVYFSRSLMRNGEVVTEVRSECGQCVGMNDGDQENADEAGAGASSHF